MKQLLYVMQFTGQGTLVAGSGNVLKAQTTAPSCNLETRIAEQGVAATLERAPGGQAFFESEVTVTGDNSFTESGTIRFGTGGHTLRFSTVGQGYLDASPDPNLRHGTVTWRVDSGSGQFEGASGLITSNFTMSQDGRVVDNHCGLLFVR